MHFVLWGLHQLSTFGFVASDDRFNALRALGSSSTSSWWRNTLLFLFQCTSCFGVFINGAEETGSGHPGGFNALRALGSSSTCAALLLRSDSDVSMHFVLWGLHQLLSGPVM